ncbi:MAG: cold shock domain-containing protein [Flavobacteriales bacterium]|nr:cold shock domain-containing protein [Flavobacteriales bacterium]
MQNGTVKFFNHVKGFGFITAADGKEYFVHKSNVQGSIRDGDEVTFEVGEGQKGPMAMNVKKA